MTAPPLVSTASGRVMGRWRDHRDDRGVTTRHATFLGIPYAAAPVGDARFAAPRPVAPWDGVREVVLHGPTPQRGAPFADPTIPEPSIPGSETLTVSVTTPDPSPGAGLPVLVWIHGGGYIGGSPASPWYSGQAFARDGVVTVSVSYRLAFEGFGWVDGAVNNRGVRDWLAALEWVQRNIASFGGDPARVTIGGQSAGGSAVMQLLSMRAAQHLFASVLAISPAAASQTVERARELARRIAVRASVTPDLAGFASVDEITLLESLVAGDEPSSTDPLVALIADAANALTLTPTIDGDIIEDTVAAALESGVGAGKSLLIGSTAHEFNGVAASIEAESAGRDVAAVLEAAGLPGSLARAMAAREHERGPAWGLAQAYSDMIFRRCVPGWAGIRERSGAEPTWAYDFRWESRAPGFVGAAHCLDLPFGFDILQRSDARRVTGDAPQELADAVHADWLALIRGVGVAAPRYGTERSTIVYRGESIRTIEPGYELENALWDATSD